MMDKQRFAEEVQSLLPTLYRVSMSILRSDADAQDAVQQSLMKAWNKREFARAEGFHAWVTRIVIHECRNIQRNQMRVVPMDVMYEQQGYQPPDMDLSEAVHTLPENLRIPFMLKYSEGYSEKEIVVALRLPLPTVKNRLYRARHALEKALRAEVSYQ